MVTNYKITTISPYYNNFDSKICENCKIKLSLAHITAIFSNFAIIKGNLAY